MPIQFAFENIFFFVLIKQLNQSPIKHSDWQDNALPQGQPCNQNLLQR